MVEAIRPQSRDERPWLITMGTICAAIIFYGSALETSCQNTYLAFLELGSGRPSILK